MLKAPVVLLASVLAMTLPRICIAQEVDVSSLQIVPPAGANPQVVYTNKKSAFFQTQTRVNDHPEHAWFRGFNIAGRRVFQDVSVTFDGIQLDPALAMTTIQPNELKRVYPSGVIEKLRLYDNQDVTGLEYPDRFARPQIALRGEGLEQLAPQLYVNRTSGDPLYVAIATNPGRAFIAVASSALGAQELSFRAALLADGWTSARNQRMSALLSNDHYLDAGAQTSALRWMTLSLDALVTRQRGTGIYAGLPWFQEYWGRDQFIALPGATLVNGQFDAAKNILSSFARFQDQDANSRFYGRLPNIVKPNELDYHTTDGTPRFVIALRDYVDYSGDIGFAKELFPVVKASIEGSLANFTDDAGYLLHADNETWMDARREPDKVSYSPRANRANDIQALWVQQLEAGALFATLSGDAASASKWRDHAAKVRANFARDFVRQGRITDHLNADGSRDLQVRPNAFFAFDLVDPSVRRTQLPVLWSQLVYPWGVATLSASDRQFLPYHWSPGNWHKDAAYHNGTVWPWLDGIAMQRMIEAGGVDAAFKIFAFNNQLALKTNGSLPETMDAFPHSGEEFPHLTGTYSQAWSLAEQLRVWQQWFVGVRPQLTRDEVILAPRLPKGQTAVLNTRVGKGWVRTRCTVATCTWTFEGISTTARLSLQGYKDIALPMQKGDKLAVSLRSGAYSQSRNVRRQLTGKLVKNPDWHPITAAPFAKPN